MPDPDPWDFSDYADPSSNAGNGAVIGGGRSRSTGEDESEQLTIGGPVRGASTHSDLTGGSNWTLGETGSDGVGGFPGSGARSLEIATPPFGQLALAAGLSLVALAMATWLGAVPGIAVAAWVLAGPVAIGVLAWFVRRDTLQRSRPVYVAPSWLRAAYVAAVALAGLAVLVAALRIAFWVGRL